MKKVLQTIAAVIACSTFLLSADEVNINGKFVKDPKGQTGWNLNSASKREGVTLEVIEASDKKSNAIFVEADNKSVYTSSPLIYKLSSYKELNFSVDVRGSGGFAVQLTLFTNGLRYLKTMLFLENRGGGGDTVKTVTGKLEIPTEVNGKPVKYGRINLLSFAHSQLVYENVKLDGVKR